MGLPGSACCHTHKHTHTCTVVLSLLLIHSLSSHFILYFLLHSHVILHCSYLLHSSINLPLYSIYFSSLSWFPLSLSFFPFTFTLFIPLSSFSSLTYFSHLASSQSLLLFYIITVFFSLSPSFLFPSLSCNSCMVLRPVWFVVETFVSQSPITSICVYFIIIIIIIWRGAEERQRSSGWQENHHWFLLCTENHDNWEREREPIIYILGVVVSFILHLFLSMMESIRCTYWLTHLVKSQGGGPLGTVKWNVNLYFSWRLEILLELVSCGTQASLPPSFLPSHQPAMIPSFSDSFINFEKPTNGQDLPWVFFLTCIKNLAVW